MSNIDRVITEYLAAWNTSDAKERLSLITKVLAPHCLYADAHLPDTIETTQEHSEFIDRFKNKFPELKISLVNIPDVHHGFFRFRWQLTQPNGDKFTQGVFFGETNQNHKIVKLIGFVD